MRRLLGTLTILLLLAAGASACGDDSSDTADDPSPTSKSSDAAESTEVAILSETAAGGTVSTTAVPLPDRAAVDAFAAQFDGPELGRKILDEIASTQVSDDQVVAGAVVSIGCDVPPGVTVSDSGDGLEIVPDKVASPMPECFAPVTSVALVLVDAGLV